MAASNEYSVYVGLCILSEFYVIIGLDRSAVHTVLCVAWPPPGGVEHRIGVHFAELQDECSSAWRRQEGSSTIKAGRNV